MTREDAVEPTWREKRRLANVRKRLDSITTRDLCAEVARRHPRKDVGFACARAVRHNPDFMDDLGSGQSGRTEQVG